METKIMVILRKLLVYSGRVLDYCEEANYEQFLKDQKLIDACVMNLSNMGELSRHMPEEFKDAHPEIPWGAIYFMRNRIVHDYEGLRLEIVWQTIQSSIPELREQLIQLTKEINP